MLVYEAIFSFFKVSVERIKGASVPAKKIFFLSDIGDSLTSQTLYQLLRRKRKGQVKLS